MNLAQSSITKEPFGALFFDLSSAAQTKGILIPKVILKKYFLKM